MRKTKTKTGSRFACLFAALTLLLAPAPAREKEKRKTAAVAASATLAGTVFRDSGFALRGAEVVVTVATPDAPAASNKRKKKDIEWRAVADARGEFFLRLPPGPASYNVVVRAEGFQPQQKSVTYSADERLDFSFLLQPVGEKK